MVEHKLTARCLFPWEHTLWQRATSFDSLGVASIICIAQWGLGLGIGEPGAIGGEGWEGRDWSNPPGH